MKNSLKDDITAMRGEFNINVEDLYRLFDSIPESKWADVARYLKIKAMPTEAPTDAEIEALRQKDANGDFYRYATTDDLKAGFKRVNEMIMNRNEFNEVFEVTVSKERWVSLKTYLRDLNQPDNMPTPHEIEIFRLHEIEKNSPDYVTYSHEEIMERYIDDYDDSLDKVILEDLLQSIDYMSYEHIALVSEFVKKLEDEAEVYLR